MSRKVEECKPLTEGGVEQGDGAGDGRWPDIRRHEGRAVQVVPMKPKLQPPGTQRLKLQCDILLSNSAFEFNSRRSMKGGKLSVDEIAIKEKRAEALRKADASEKEASSGGGGGEEGGGGIGGMNGGDNPDGVMTW